MTAASAILHMLQVPAEFAGSRLDLALARLIPQHSRSRLQNWIQAGQVTVDANIVTEPKWKLRGSEQVAVTEATDFATTPNAPEDIALSITYEDDAILVLDKAAGLVVHPGSGNWHGTLLNALLHHAPALATLPRAGIVHRLDKDTSGLMVVAKTDLAQTELVRQLQARTIRREYLAVVHGNVERPVTIDAPIGRHPTHRTSMAVVERGKPARTHVEIVERFGSATLVACRLETGRTHQIRVHLTAIGHPLLGDATYRGRVTGAGPLPAAARAFPRQALHARRLGLVHPETHADMQWEAPPPPDLVGLLSLLRADAK